jgi:IclR family transcriptional regulator, KDG regulon repressor
MSRSLKSQGRKKIGALQRAFDIVNLFGANTPELGNGEIADALGLHKSTVAGLIYTLEANGYLTQNPATRKYRLGFVFVERASVLLSHLEIREIARPHLEQLRNACNETVNLGVRDGADIVYIERLSGNQTLVMRSEVGRREPVHATALGKAILAWLSTTDVNATVPRTAFKARTPNTLTNRTALSRNLQETRERGYAIDDEENEIGGRCVAAPIFDSAGCPIAAVSISIPTQRASLNDLARFGAQVRETARTVSASMGYLPKLTQAASHK